MDRLNLCVCWHVCLSLNLVLNRLDMHVCRPSDLGIMEAENPHAVKHESDSKSPLKMDGGDSSGGGSGGLESERGVGGDIPVRCKDG